MDIRLFHLIATVIDACDQQPSHGPGHPPSRETIRIVATLRRFLREGTPWRGLRATTDQASGSTLCRCLGRWVETGLLAKVHALLAAMLRGHPDLILDSCSVRAKRGGDHTGPNPTDRGKRGTKYHIATNGNGVPVACIATAANVNDTLVFERLFLAAFAVMARIRTVFADKGSPSCGRMVRRRGNRGSAIRCRDRLSSGRSIPARCRHRPSERCSPTDQVSVRRGPPCVEAAMWAVWKHRCK